MTQWKRFVQPERQGTEHIENENKPCQDKAAIVENDKYIVGVLCDGVGSLRYSQIAAEAVVDSITKFLIEYDYEGKDVDTLKCEIINICQESIENKADEMQVSISEMDCTFLFVVIHKESDRYMIGQLGDGAICVIKPNEAVIFSEVEGIKKAGANATSTVQGSKAIEYFNVEEGLLSDICGFVVVSDGLQNEIYSKAGKVKRMLQWYYNTISMNEEAFAIEQVKERWDKLTENEDYGFCDDMSLLAIVHSQKEIELSEDPTWLCICENRNRLENSWCSHCGRDITKVYKGVRFKENGGKRNYFAMLNLNPEEEKRVLEEFCSYEKIESEQKIIEEIEHEEEEKCEGCNENIEQSEFLVVVEEKTDNSQTVLGKEQKHNAILTFCCKVVEKFKHNLIRTKSAQKEENEKKDDMDITLVIFIGLGIYVIGVLSGILVTLL